MAIKFKKYHRFDQSKAEYGVEHPIRDAAGNYYGKFKTSLFDPYSKYVQVATERFQRDNKDNSILEGEHANLFAFVEICLHDWKDVLDDKGKQVPFTKEAAFELLNDEDNLWLRNTLIEMTTDIANYKHDPVVKQDEDLGN